MGYGLVKGEKAFEWPTARNAVGATVAGFLGELIHLARASSRVISADAEFNTTDE